MSLNRQDRMESNLLLEGLSLHRSLETLSTVTEGGVYAGIG